jgi:hypothetical protein
MKKFRLYLLMACAILFLHPLQAVRLSVEQAGKVARKYAQVTPRLSVRSDCKLDRTLTLRAYAGEGTCYQSNTNPATFVSIILQSI